MKYLSMPLGMWTLFNKSFEKNLMIVFNYNKKEANIKIVEAMNKFKTLSKKEDIYNYYNNVIDRVFCLNYESTFD